MIPVVRTKQTYLERVAGQNDQEKIDGVNAMMKNFENFCMEKFGKAEIVNDMKEMPN